MVWRVKQLLEDSNIPCFIKNEFAIGAMGELSPLDNLPEVWLTDNEWQAKATALVADFSAEPVSQENWKCQQCDEDNEGSFLICWSCETPKPDVSQV